MVSKISDDALKAYLREGNEFLLGGNTYFERMATSIENSVRDSEHEAAIEARRCTAQLRAAQTDLKRAHWLALAIESADRYRFAPPGKKAGKWSAAVIECACAAGWNRKRTWAAIENDIERFEKVSSTELKFKADGHSLSSATFKDVLYRLKTAYEKKIAV